MRFVGGNWEEPNCVVFVDVKLEVDAAGLRAHNAQLDFVRFGGGVALDESVLLGLAICV